MPLPAPNRWAARRSNSRLSGFEPPVTPLQLIADAVPAHAVGMVGGRFARPPPIRAPRLKQREKLVQQVDELVRRHALVEQTGDPAQEVPEEVPWPGLCRDVQVDLIEVDL